MRCDVVLNLLLFNMPRQARIDAPGSLHHIISRGIERRRIFQDDVDRDDFVARLNKVMDDTKTSCYAWALMPNHFHLLLRTGNVPISTVMRRLLTGYAVRFNRRHDRCGHLFQNRYKSILCQENSYLKELVRYIHLNPLRAGIVENLDSLCDYCYSGHSRLMGNIVDGWQDTDTILRLYGVKDRSARKEYYKFVEKGISQGRLSELTGGGLVRSEGGWQELKSKRRMRMHLKGDERILGDSDYVESVLKKAEENLARKYRLRSKGLDFKFVLKRVSDIYKIPIHIIQQPGRDRERVIARSVAAYWAVRELGIPGTKVGLQLGLSQSAVSRAVKRGEQLVVNAAFRFEE